MRFLDAASLSERTTVPNTVPEPVTTVADTGQLAYPDTLESLRPVLAKWDRGLTLLFATIATPMDDKDHWEGTPTQLKAQLETVARDVWGIEPSTGCRGWPKGPARFARAVYGLPPLLTPLGIGIGIGSDVVEHRRAIRLYRRWTLCGLLR